MTFSSSKRATLVMASILLVSTTSIAFAQIQNNTQEKNKELAKKLRNLELEKQVFGKQVMSFSKIHDIVNVKSLTSKYNAIQDQEDKILKEIAERHPVVHVRHLSSSRLPKTLDPSAGSKFNWSGYYVGCDWNLSGSYGIGNAYANTPRMSLQGTSSTVIYSTTPGPWGTTCQPQLYSGQVQVKVEDLLTGEIYLSDIDDSGSPYGINVMTDIIDPDIYHSLNPYFVTIWFYYTDGNTIQATGQFIA